MPLPKKFRVNVFFWWLLWVWYWRNPFHKWGTAGRAVAERYCAAVLAQEGKITTAALDILNERIRAQENHVRRVSLLRLVVLPVLVLSTMGIVVHVDVQGAQFDLNAKLREILLLLAVTLTVYLNYTGFVSSALYSCVKEGARRANLSDALRYKYMSNIDLFLEFVLSKEERNSLLYVLNVLALLLFYLAHLIVFLFLDIAAYFYVAFAIRANPAFGETSLAISNYAIFATSAVFVFTLMFTVVRFRYYRSEFKKKRKNRVRYLKLFVRICGYETNYGRTPIAFLETIQAEISNRY